MSNSLTMKKSRNENHIDLHEPEPLLNRYPSSNSTMLFSSSSPFATRLGNNRRESTSGSKRLCVPAKKSRCFFILLVAALLSLVGLRFFFNYYDGTSWWLQIASNASSNFPHNLWRENGNNERYGGAENLTSTVLVNLVNYDMIQQQGTQFNVNGSDVLVFLHIQKTGGTTFEKHLVNDIDLEAPCNCKTKKQRKVGRRRGKKRRGKKQPRRCQCFRPGSTNSSWLFSRYNAGWKCGLHADWTELTECVDDYLKASEGPANRSYYYMTFLRDPVARFMSEFLHVQRGATWKKSLYVCNGKPATAEEISPCYNGVDWSGVSFEEFSSCPSNMAFNRQTRMLADLRLVNCYSRMVGTAKERRESTMLESAKMNLEKMAFFGLTSKQAKSQFLFEDTFDLKFNVAFDKRDDEDQQSSLALADLDESTVRKIKLLNSLDVELYEFAKRLMEKRYKEAQLRPGGM